MAKMQEADIEELALEHLRELGYAYAHGQDIGPGGARELRGSLSQTLLEPVLEKAVARLNPSLVPALREEALRMVRRAHAPELVSANEAFHQMLVKGIKVSRLQDGAERGDLVRLLDFDRPENNEFLAVNQFSVTEGNVTKRPDIVLFVNGMPLVVLELKNAVDEKATLHHAYNQLQTYKATIPSLLRYNSLLVISDGLEARAGSLTADYGRFMAWRSEDGRKEADKYTSQLEVLLRGLLQPVVLLDMIRFFTVFEKTRSEDASGQTVIKTAKKVAGYHQYYAATRPWPPRCGLPHGMMSNRARAVWCGTPRAAESRCPWCFIRPRSCIVSRTRPWWC